MPPVLTFSGYAGSGKTTLLSRIVRLLSEQGVRVGVVKHTHHLEMTGQPGKKDTDLFLEAGAKRVALSGPAHGIVFPPQPGDPGPLVAAAELKEIDIVLAEGFKRWPGFKVEVLAAGAEPSLLDDPYLLALASSAGDRSKAGPVCWLDRDDPEEAARFVIGCFLPPDRSGPAPDREKCFGLMARYEMRPNIIVHSLAVDEAARRLGAALVRSGHWLDLPIVEAGALLHDIAKTECLGTRYNHAERGFEILAGLGYPGVALVVAEHIDPQAALEKRGLVSPSVVINYADKRVLHDRVVPLAERTADLIERYGTTAEKVGWLKELARNSAALEEKLLDLVGRDPIDGDAINRLFGPRE